MALIVQYQGHGQYAIRATHFSPALRRVGRKVPGMRYEEGMWQGYPDAVATAVGLLEKQSLTLSYRDRIPEAHSPLPQGGLPVSLKPSVDGKPLRKYQIDGIKWAVARAEEGCLIADDLGLGKSVQAIRAARAFHAPTLIVCPSFARGVWGDSKDSQIAKWWPEAWPPRILSGVHPEKVYPSIAKTGAIPLVPVTVCHYDILYAWAPYLKGNIKVVVFDEARYLQSERSKRSLAAREIAGEAQARIGLDGTPVSNHTSALWNVLDTLSPGRFGKPFAFFLRYCAAHQEQITVRKDQNDEHAITRLVWKYDGLSNEEELHARLEYMMLRRTKSDVKMELPPRIRQIIEVDVDDKFKMGPDVALRSDISLRRALDLAADGKIPDGIERVKSHAAGGHNVVVFTHRQAVCEHITLACRGAGLVSEFVHGGVRQKERERRYLSRPQVLVANMDCVAGAIDLSYADVDVFLELDYDPQKVLQCSGRLHRFGQKRTVIEEFVIGRGTIDELIRDRMVKKLDLFDKVIGKTDDKLKADLDKSSREAGAADLRRFWESLQEGD